MTLFLESILDNFIHFYLLTQFELTPQRNFIYNLFQFLLLQYHINFKNNIIKFDKKYFLILH
jgi:hypothetical protein